MIRSSIRCYSSASGSGSGSGGVMSGNAPMHSCITILTGLFGATFIGFLTVRSSAIPSLPNHALQFYSAAVLEMYILLSLPAPIRVSTIPSSTIVITSKHCSVIVPAVISGEELSLTPSESVDVTITGI